VQKVIMTLHLSDRTVQALHLHPMLTSISAMDSDTVPGMALVLGGDTPIMVIPGLEDILIMAGTAPGDGMIRFIAGIREVTGTVIGMATGTITGMVIMGSPIIMALHPIMEDGT